VSDTFGSVPNNYTVSAAAVTADFTDNPTHPGSLAVGGSASGALTNIGQSDWIAVSLTANQAYEFTIVGAVAEIAVASDLSGDGKSDILWQNSSGEGDVWELNGASVIGGGSLGNPGRSCHVAGDSNPYGAAGADLRWQTDGTGILVQNDTGEAFLWATNGSAVTGGGSLGNPGPAWQAISTATGTPTSCGRTTAVEAVIWELNRANVIGGGSIDNPGPAGTSPESAISTMTVVPTFCGRTTAAKRRFGDQRRQGDRRRQPRQPRPHLAHLSMSRELL
jgi:hypothetical protein